MANNFNNLSKKAVQFIKLCKRDVVVTESFSPLQNSKKIVRRTLLTVLVKLEVYNGNKYL